MTFAVFHDFPGQENGPPKFHGSPGPVGTLLCTLSVFMVDIFDTRENGL